MDPDKKIFDGLSGMMNDALGLMEGVRREAETLARTTAERAMHELDVAKREDVEAAQRALELRLEKIEQRLAMLEEKASKTADSGL